LLHAILRQIFFHFHFLFDFDFDFDFLIKLKSIIKFITIPLTLNNVVVPECLCREPSGFTAFKVAGSPTQAFGDDDFVALNSHVLSEP